MAKLEDDPLELCCEKSSQSDERLWSYRNEIKWLIFIQTDNYSAGLTLQNTGRKSFKLGFIKSWNLKEYILESCKQFINGWKTIRVNFNNNISKISKQEMLKSKPYEKLAKQIPNPYNIPPACSQSSQFYNYRFNIEYKEKVQNINDK